MSGLRPILPLLICFWIAAGCGASRPPLITATMTPEEVMRAIEGRNGGIRSLRGYGQISIDTPEITNSGNISVTLTKPDSLLVDITGPFGVGVARGLVTSTEFRFYNGLENKLFLGETNPENIRAILRMQIAFADILDLFSGCMNFNARPPGVSPRGAWKGSEYAISFDGPDGLVEYTVDTGYESIVRYVKRSREGELVEEIRLKDFHRTSDLYLPRVITLTRPAMEQSLALIYDSQVINELPLDFGLKIPSSAVKVRM